MSGIILIIQTLRKDRTVSIKRSHSRRKVVKVLDLILKVEHQVVLEVLVEADPMVHVVAKALVNLVDLVEDEVQVVERDDLVK